MLVFNIDISSQNLSRQRFIGAKGSMSGSLLYINKTIND